MKKLLFISILIMTFQIAKSQNFGPTQHPIMLDGVPTMLDPEMAYFKQDKVIRGWHWNVLYKISNSLRMNSVDLPHKFLRSPNIDFRNANSRDRIEDSTMMLLKVDYGIEPISITTHKGSKDILNARAIQFEPTLRLAAFGDSLRTRPSDPSRPIFGFKHIVGTILNNPADENYSRLILRKKDLISRQLVLDQTNPGDLMSMYYYTILNDTNNYNDCAKLFNGKHWYISINLRKLQECYSELDTILKIEVPYRWFVVTKKYNMDVLTLQPEELMVFDSIPTDYPLAYDSLVRGKRWRMNEPTPQNDTTAFYITKKMLENINEDITISAHFTLLSEDNTHQLKPDRAHPSSEFYRNIDTMNIRVTYMGECDVAIDWIRFETPNARKLFWGDWDKYLVDTISSTMNHFTKKDTISKGSRIIRFNSHIECTPLHWMSEKYLDELIGKIHTGEAWRDYPKLYDYYVNPTIRWTETDDVWTSIRVPYITNKPDKEWKTMGLKCGYSFGRTKYNGKDTTYILDSLESEYETWLWSGLSPSQTKTLPMEEYLSVNNCGFGSQEISRLAFNESLIYDLYVNPIKNDYHFKRKPWWPQNFSLSSFNTVITNNNDTTYQYASSRAPWLAEDIRFRSWNLIIMGAKGLFWDGAQDGDKRIRLSYNPDSVLKYFSNNINIAKDSLLNMSGRRYLLSNSIAGGDFFETDDMVNVTKMRFSKNALDTIAKYFNTSPDRVYHGRKSKRIETYKINKFLEVNEYYLMKLQLMAWYGCGFKEWYQYAPEVADTNILWNYISKNDLKTRKVFLPIRDSQGIMNPTDYEVHDSAFFDITLHRDTSVSMNEKVIIGVQNRRTDPLIYFTEEANKYMLFLTGGDFEDFIIADSSVNPKSGIKYSKSLWQSYWWKRLGCREITIPIKNRVKPGHHLIVKVKEVGTGTELDDEWWRKDGYMDIVDTAYAFSETDNTPQNIVVKMLPGEGKLLEVTYQYSNLSADLAYSNQHKIVQYPTEFDSEGKPTKVKYHSTYYHYNNSPGRFNVFYRRSVESDPDLPFTAIRWEDEVNISLNLYKSLYLPDNVNNKHFDFKYPSIVVRESNSIPTVYIVFQGRSQEATNYGGIFEMKFPADLDRYEISKMTKNIETLEWFEYIGEVSENWGTPVVNAAKWGNYYAWTLPDIKGIRAAWKTPESNNINYGDHFIHLSFTPFYNIPEQVSHIAHPSLNNYSRLELDDDCSIVWEEGTEKRSHVMYSRLRVEDGKLINYVPYEKLYSNTGDPLVGWDNKAFCMSCIYDESYNQYDEMISSEESSHEKPFIVRNQLRQYSYLDTTEMYKDIFERIYWELYDKGRSISTNDRRTASIATRYIYMLEKDTLNQGQNSIGYPFRIYQDNHQLLQPNASQFSTEYTSDFENLKDYCLNFISTPETEVPTSGNSIIWQIFHNQYELYPYGYPNYIVFDDLNKVVNEHRIPLVSQLEVPGQFPHLASVPRSYNSDQRRFAARLFQFGLPSPFVFSKRAAADNINLAFFGYADTARNTYLMSSINFEDENQNLNLIKTSNYENFKNKYKDTIYSDWFRISEGSLNYITEGKRSTLVKTLLQRKSDGRIYNLNTTNQGTMKYNYNKQKLINGNNNEYRLLFVKNTSKSYYTEELALATNLDIIEFNNSTTFPKSVAGLYEDITDLGDGQINKPLTIYPNPANDKLYLNTPEINKGLVKIYSSLGTLMLALPFNDNNTKVIDISNIQSGLYNVVVEYPNEIGMTTNINSTFIISR